MTDAQQDSRQIAILVANGATESEAITYLLHGADLGRQAERGEITWQQAFRIVVAEAELLAEVAETRRRQ